MRLKKNKSLIYLFPSDNNIVCVYPNTSDYCKQTIHNVLKEKKKKKSYINLKQEKKKQTKKLQQKTNPLITKFAKNHEL